MSKTYCILPFTHIATERNGNYMPCCASKETTGHNLQTDNVETVWNSEYYQKLRSDLLSGIHHSNCSQCWEYESLGITSKRQISNQNKKILNEALPMPIDLDIKTGNLCNLKCITCNQLASSLHEEEVVEWKNNNIELPAWLKIIDNNNTILNLKDTSNVASNLDQALKSAKFMTLSGGEPFVTPLSEKILDYCIQKDYTDIGVNMITNLTTVTPKILNRIKKFPNADIAVSYDHIDPAKSNFIRYPADYQHFIKNLDYIIEDKSFKFGISFTISIFNALDLDKIFERFIELSELENFKFINVQPVIEPLYFCILYLEEEQKDQIYNSINRVLNQKTKLTRDENFVNRLKDILYNLKLPPENFNDIVKERTRVLNLYDQTRKTDYKKLFPYIKIYE